MAADPLAVVVRRETEVLIGRLVMQNTTLTAQMAALSEAYAALQKELADTKAMPTPDRNGHVPEETVR